MAGFLDRFGGSSVQAAQVAFRAVSLAANAVTLWPPYAKSDTVLARIMQVVALGGERTLTLPDATLASPGQDVFVNNVGSFAVTVLNAAGQSLAAVTPGQVKYFYLADASTPAGQWRVVLLGAIASNSDAGALAGSGLLALGATLNASAKVGTFAANTLVAPADRANVFVWTGGTGTLTLPLSSSIMDFFIEVRNQGAGALTINTTGGETIDASTNIALQVGESAFVHAGTGAWYTVGRGRSTQFSFTQLIKTVTGGSITLSLTEAANVVQTYNGVLSSAQTIVLPPLVQVYYVSNQTSGAFAFNVKTAGVGTTVPIPTGQNAVLFCDGTNVINASTTVAGISSLVMGAGTAATPSLAIGTTTTGLYSAVGGEVSVSSAGAKVAAIDASGIAVVVPNGAVGVIAPTGTATLVADRQAGQTGLVSFRTNGTNRFDVGVNTTTEGGGNSGSGLVVRRYSDAGALIDTPLAIDRATGAVSFANALVINGLQDAAAIGRIEQYVGSTTPINCLVADGSLVSRVTYAKLWTYAQAQSPVTEPVWSAGQSGRFSVGDGTTTFRLPDLRGVFVRGLDLGRGLDTGRVWGDYQDQANAPHNHGVNDPTHAHSVYDPSHAHGVADPGHTHGVNDPGHVHSYTGWQNGFITNAGVQRTTYDPVTGNTAAAATGISLNGAGTGIGIYGAYTGIAIYGAGTGITIASAGTEGHPRNVAYPRFIRYQ